MSEIRGKNKDWITKNFNKKQDLLVPGKNIKTINGESILGEGDLIIGPSLKVLDLREETAQLVLNPSETVEITDAGKVALISEIENLCGEQIASVPYILQSTWGVSHIQANVVINSELNAYLEIYCPIIKPNAISNYETTFSKFIFERGSEKWTLSIKYLRNVDYEEAGNYVLWLNIRNNTTPDPLTDEQKRILELILNQAEDRVQKSLLVYLRYNNSTIYSSSNATVLVSKNKMLIDFFSAINESGISYAPIRLTISPIVIDNNIDLSNATVSLSYIDYFQEKLVSGTNIKTINGQSILGSGDLEISGGSGGLKVLDLIMESVSIVVGQTASSEITDIIKINIINEIRNLVSDYSETPIPLPSSNYIVSYYFGMCAIQASIRASSDNKRVLLLTAPLSFVNMEVQQVENIMGKLVLTPDNDTNPTKYTLIIEKDISSSSNLILNIGVNDDATSLKPITEEQKQIVKEMCGELANAQNGTATREMSVYFFNGLAFYISQNILYSPLEENMYIDFLVDRGENNGLKPVRITIGNIKYSSSGGIDTSNITMEGGRIENYQYKLVSGTNIKTINGESLLGSGNITIESGTNINFNIDDNGDLIVDYK